MTGQALRLTKISLALLCVTALGACKKSENAVDTAAARTDSAAGRVDSAATTSASNMANTAGKWSNDHIFGYVHNANNGEIALGKLAATKATNSQVKAFGSQMVKDHQAMMSDAHALMGKVNAAVDSTWDDAKDLAGDGAEKLKELNEKAKGADWDKNYIESQVDMHQRVLDKLQDAVKNSSDTTVTASLAKATAKVQEHLTKAQSIKAGLDNKQ